MPTLLFGIPGSGSMAIFLGGMVLLGIQPGPSMVSTNLDLTYTIIWSLALANVLGAGLCLALAQPIAKLTTIRFTLLAPFMIMVISFAAFQATRELYDLVFLFLVGLLGVFLKRFGWPRPAFLIGFVLAGQAETYLYQAVQFYGWSFFSRTGVMIIIAITLVSVWLGSRSRVGEQGVVRAAPAGAAAAEEKPILPRRPQAVFAALMLALSVYALVGAWQKSFLGGIFPLLAAAAAFIFSALLLGAILFGRQGNSAHYDQEHQEPFRELGTAGLWLNIAWFAGLLVASALVGFVLALVGFFIAFLRIRAEVSWPRTIALTAAGVGLMLLLGYFLVLDFPRGLLQDIVRLPWPLR
jgi:putative tricarboxylic transport membrane protein